MQLVNLLTAPLQFGLLIPFHRLGQLLLPGAAGPQVPGETHSQTWGLLTGIWTLAVHAIAGWSCVCVPLGILLFLALRVGRHFRPRVVTV